MPFGLLIVGIIFSIIAALTTLILSIIHLATSRQRSALMLGVAFIMSMIMLILSIMEVIERGSGKVKDGIGWIKKMEEKNKSKWGSYGNYDEYYYGYIPEGNNDTINADFYSSRGTDTSYIPLVFPYRFASEDVFMSFPHIEVMRGSKSFLPTEADSCLVSLQCISDFTFDEKMLLAKRDNKELKKRFKEWKKLDIPDNSFILFDFTTGDCQEFWSEDLLKEEASKRGFRGKKYLDMTATHYLIYSSNEDE